MTDELKELISKADRGDGAAQKELMKRGDDAITAGDHEQAGFFYKMAAMAYRIAASRNSSMAGEAGGKLWWQEQVVAMYRRWIDKYTTPVRPRMHVLTETKLPGDLEHIFMQIYRSRDDVFWPLMRHLENELVKRGVEMCAPGGTMNRHFVYMMNGRIYGREAYETFPSEIDIRVALDPIVDEIMYRMEHPEPAPKTVKRKRSQK